MLDVIASSSLGRYDERMKKRAIIVHGWGGNPEYVWYPWLKAELEARDFAVSVPAMPETEEPKVQTLTSVVGTPDHHTYLVGHSMGCQTILRYLATLPEDAQIGGVVLVAGFYTLVPLEPEQARIAEPWLTTPIDAVAVKEHTKRTVAIFSNNDPWVPIENEQLLKEQLGAETIILHNRGHFSGADRAVELPEALTALLDIAKK